MNDGLTILFTFLIIIYGIQLVGVVYFLRAEEWDDKREFLLNLIPFFFCYYLGLAVGEWMVETINYFKKL